MNNIMENNKTPARKAFMTLYFAMVAEENRALVERNRYLGKYLKLLGLKPCLLHDADPEIEAERYHGKSPEYIKNEGFKVGFIFRSCRGRHRRDPGQGELFSKCGNGYYSEYGEVMYTYPDGDTIGFKRGNIDEWYVLCNPSRGDKDADFFRPILELKEVAGREEIWDDVEKIYEATRDTTGLPTDIVVLIESISEKYDKQL